MSNNLAPLMKHIEYFYEDVPSSYDSDIKQNIYLKDTVWTITNKVTNVSIETKNHMTALEYLIDTKSDLAIFHNMILDSVTTEGVLRRMQLKKVEELVGTEAIDKGEERWAKFADSLVSAITEATDETEKKETGLRIV